MNLPDAGRALRNRFRRPGPWLGLSIVLVPVLPGFRRPDTATSALWILGWGLVSGVAIFLQPFCWQWSGDPRRCVSLARGTMQTIGFWWLFLGVFAVMAHQAGAWPHAFLSGLARTLAVGLLVSLLLGPIGYLMARWELRSWGASAAQAQASDLAWTAPGDLISSSLLSAQLEFLANLAEREPRSAERGILDLADFYRSWLAHVGPPRLSWRSERTLAERWLSLENQWRTTPVHIAWQCPAFLESVEVPAFLLCQLLATALADPGCSRLAISLASVEARLQLSLQAQGTRERPSPRGLSSIQERLLGRGQATLASLPDGWRMDLAIEGSRP